MTHTEGTETTRDGLKLRTQRWLPDGPETRGVIILTHGHGEHSSRYGHVGAGLCAAGYAVYAYDRRGHGRSEGPRGHVPGYDAALDDLEIVAARGRGENPGQPWFLMGHSLGGHTSLYFGLRRRPDAAGVVVTSPWLRPTTSPSSLVTLVGRFLARVAPTFAFNAGVSDLRRLSHDVAFLEAMPDLGLSHSTISARLGADIFDVGEHVLAHAAEFHLPLLLLQAGADQLASPQAAQLFYERAGSADKTYGEYPGLYHEILNETERGAVLRTIIDWLDQRAPR